MAYFCALPGSSNQLTKYRAVITTIAITYLFLQKKKIDLFTNSDHRSRNLDQFILL